MRKFSIIIPTYNSSDTLSRTMESIVGQTYNDLEVIIMDGVSNDNTLAVAKKYSEKIANLLIISEKDNGIYDAMNKAIDVATGEWVLFLGSDDTLYDKNTLAKVSNYIETTQAPVLYGSAKILGDTGWAKDGEIYAGEFNLPKLLNQNICHQAIFYNREFIKDKVGYFSLDYKKSSDWDFNLRCWAIKPFEYMDLIVANFKAGGFSTHSTDHKIVDDFVNNVRTYFKIDLFNPLINNPGFIFYGQVRQKQQAENRIRFNFVKVIKKIKKKFNG